MPARPAALLPILAEAQSAGMVGPAATDRDLLRRFARTKDEAAFAASSLVRANRRSRSRTKDEAAFAALVRRHGAMVLAACGRVLGNSTDAEDACQATFLVLARKAGSARWRPSIASWLYATARQVALNARTARARRARHEGRAAHKAPANPLARISGEELLAILDEELGRLPERYRAPLVLCCLEGLTRDEAARRLGVPAATLKGQLERGRRRLHEALTKRGIALGAGLLALVATSRAGAVPARMADMVLASVRGSAPKAVADLCRGAAVNGTGTKAAFLAAAVIGIAALGVGAVQPPADDPKSDKAMPAKAAAKKEAPAAKPVARAQAPTVTGKVVDPAGKPLAGAKLLLIGKGDRPAELGTSGADGRFAVTLPTDWQDSYLVARADGFGIDFLRLSDTEPEGEVELRAVADSSVRGRVIDTEGKPVTGVSVRVDRLGTSSGNSLDPILAGWKKLDGFAAAPAGEKQIWHGAGTLWTATSDKDGRFEFRGVGVERLAVLRLSGGGVTDCEAYVANRKELDPTEYNDAAVKNARGGFGSGKPRWRMYGPDFAVVAEREKLIRGRVTDVDTGKPRPGVHVLLTRTDGGNLLEVILGGWTDKDGHYEIRGARKANSYMVEVAADTKEGYMPAQASSGDTTGYEPLTLDLRVKKGVIVTGRMINKASGKPVVGFAMIGVPQGNPSVKDYPSFGQSAWFPTQDTDSEGRFRLVTIPGPVLLFGGPNRFEEFANYKPPAADPKYPQLFKKFGDHTAYYMPGGAISPLQGRYCKVLEIKPDAKTVEQDIELEPAEPPKKAEGEKKP